MTRQSHTNIHPAREIKGSSMAGQSVIHISRDV
jgi:hypothetical protein